MRLRQRSNIREPDRYEGIVEPVQSAPPNPRSRIKPASARPAFPPPYVDYNPDLPAATFPTLDATRPAVGMNTVGSAVTNNNRGGGCRETGGLETEWMEGVVSTANGGAELEVDDCDRDEEPDACEPGHEEPEFKVPDKIEWGDLSLTLRAEIIGSMALVYNWPNVMSLLGLNSTERSEAVETLATWNNQVDTENKNLKEMQQKQIRALLRIDNSILTKMRVPAQLVFRNISKPYLRDPKTRSKPDCFMCTASEFLCAREFLRRRGLDPGFAGKWTNGFATFHVDENGQEADKLGWKPVHALGVEQAGPAFEQDTAARIGSRVSGGVSFEESQSSSRSQTQKKVDFINRLRAGVGVEQKYLKYNILQNPLNTAHQILIRKGFQQQGRFICPAPPKAANTSAVPGGQPQVQLKVGSNGAARIRSESSSLFPTQSAQVEQIRSSPPRAQESTTASLPQPIVTGAEPVNLTSATPPGLPENRHSERRESQELPLKRVLSGAWWYDSESKSQSQSQSQSDHAATPSRNLQSRLLAVRAEAELQRVAQEKRSRSVTEGGVQTNLPVRTTSSAPVVTTGYSSQLNEPKVTSSLVSTEPGESTVQGSKSPCQNQTNNPADPCRTSPETSGNEAQRLREESPQAPPFSPITPLAASSSFMEDIKEIAEQDSAALIEAPSLAPSGGTQAVKGNISLPEKRIETDTKDPASGTEKGPKSPLPQDAPVQPDDTQEALEKTPRPAPKRTRGRPRKARGGSRAVHARKKSLTEKMSGTKSLSTPAVPHIETPAKKRKVSKNETPSTGRRSPGLPVSEGRVLRPRLSGGSEKT